MTKVLFDEQPLVINKSIAKAIGLNESVVIQQINYWIKINEAKRINFIDDKYWTYNSIKNWHEQEFSFWSYATVKRTFANLEEMGLLIIGNYNKENRDRTKWYSIDYEKLEKLVNKKDEPIIEDENTLERDESEQGGMSQCIGSKCTNGLGQNAPMHWVNLHQPLPETSTETYTETSTIIKEPLTDQLKNVFDLYNKICSSLPSATLLTEARKKFIKNALKNKIDISMFENAFRNAQSSNFLTGENERGWRADFDWILKEANIVKILEGTYDNKKVNVKVDTFNNYDQRKYDYDDLEKKLLGRS